MALYDPPQRPRSGARHILMIHVHELQQVRNLRSRAGFTQKRQCILNRRIAVVSQQILRPAPQYADQQRRNGLTFGDDRVDGLPIQIAVFVHLLKQTELPQALGYRLRLPGSRSARIDVEISRAWDA